MCRNHHDLLEMAVIESLPLRHAVWTAEKFGHPITRNTRKMPILARFARQPGLEKTDCSAAKGVTVPAFLWILKEQSDFRSSVGRMPSDHKPKALRMLT
jgi:hypothetical protein